ncbi:DUF4418 family protein [Candidatus Thorarchaeota archaeon]|nr:MAG: DUF4418 family protein [Candidatus Thorarchaeota archaeon]
MKLEVILYTVLLVLGIIVAIAPWTFVSVCINPMRCWDTRTVETILGAAIAAVSLVGTFKSLQ